MHRSAKQVKLWRIGRHFTLRVLLQQGVLDVPLKWAKSVKRVSCLWRLLQESNKNRFSSLSFLVFEFSKKYSVVSFHFLFKVLDLWPFIVFSVVCFAWLKWPFYSKHWKAVRCFWIMIFFSPCLLCCFVGAQVIFRHKCSKTSTFLLTVMRQLDICNALLLNYIFFSKNKGLNIR